jgi:hypothetical protein
MARHRVLILIFMLLASVAMAGTDFVGDAYTTGTLTHYGDGTTTMVTGLGYVDVQSTAPAHLDLRNSVGGVADYWLMGEPLGRYSAVALPLGGPLAASGATTLTLRQGAGISIVGRAEDNSATISLTAPYADGSAHDSRFWNESQAAGGDTTGTLSALVVLDDSHAHTTATLPAVVSTLGASVETGEVADGTLLPADLNATAFLPWDQLASDDLTTGTVFAGDVTGLWNAMVVANDSHTHNDTTIDNGITLTNLTQITTRDHGSLTGLTDDDHSIYRLDADELAGDVTGTYTATVVGPDSHDHTGVTLPAATSYLGTAIESAEIADGTVAEADLKVVDSPADEQILTYEATTGDFEWHSPSELVTAGDHIDWTGSTLNVADDWFDALGDISLTSANIIVGNASNVAAAVAMSGDATITNAGVVAVANDSHLHGDSTVSNFITVQSLDQVTSRSHALLADKGTNTHAQIDSFISGADAAYVNVGGDTMSGPIKVSTNTITNLSRTEAGQDAIYISNNGGTGSGSYGGAIGWSSPGETGDPLLNRRAAIAAVQTNADKDVVGLAFLTHSSTDFAANLIEAGRFTGAGDLIVAGSVNGVGGLKTGAGAGTERVSAAGEFTGTKATIDNVVINGDDIYNGNTTGPFNVYSDTNDNLNLGNLGDKTFVVIDADAADQTIAAPTALLTVEQVKVGAGTPGVATGPGDEFIADDEEIDGDLDVGGNITVAGDIKGQVLYLSATHAAETAITTGYLYPKVGEVSTDTRGFYMTRAGYVLNYTVTYDVTAVSGSPDLVFQIRRPGVETVSDELLSNAAGNNQRRHVDLTRGANTFSAGETLSLRLHNQAGGASSITLANVSVNFEVVYN